MPLRDIEDVLGDIATFLRANLNAQLSALDTEKNDGLTLKPIADTAYHLQFLGDKVELADPMVLFGESDEPLVQVAGDGPGVAVTYRVGIWVILQDGGFDEKIVQRLFRYRRALKDLFKANWDTAVPCERLTVVESSPTPPFKDQETGYTGRAVGVQLKLTIVE